MLQFIRKTNKWFFFKLFQYSIMNRIFFIFFRVYIKFSRNNFSNNFRSPLRRHSRLRHKYNFSHSVSHMQLQKLMKLFPFFFHLILFNSQNYFKIFKISNRFWRKIKLLITYYIYAIIKLLDIIYYFELLLFFTFISYKMWPTRTRLRFKSS